MFRLVVLWTAILLPLGAQTTQGMISGRVVDSISGDGISAAVITVTGAAIALPAAARTGDGGYFALPLLSAGTYHVRVTAPAYQPQELYEQELAVAGRLDYDFHLRPLSDVWEQGQTRSVFLSRRTVLPFFGPDVDWSRSGSFQATEASAAALESTVSAVIDAEAVRRLPLNGRDPYALLVIQPGAASDSATARGLGLSFNGQRPSASSFLLDGVENNNYLVTGPLALVAPEAVAEYRVSTSNFSAEYGRSSGDLANVVTRAGTAAWHGTGYLYLKKEALDANGFQQNAEGVARTPRKEWQPGFWAGGPVLRDRLFVSGAFEYFRFRSAGPPQEYRLPAAGLLPYTATGAPRTGTAATVSLAAPSTLNRYLVLPRADYLARGGRHRFLVRAAVPRLREPDFLWSPYPDFTMPLQQNTASYAAAATLELRPNWTNEARAAWSSDDLRFDRPHPEVPSLSSGDGTVLPGSPAFYSYRNRTRNLELVDNLVWSTGRHVVKFGASVLIRKLDGYLTAGRDGYFSYRNLDAFLNNQPVTYRAALSRTTGNPLISPDYAREYRLVQSSFFAQDSFKVSPRLAINLGLRYERLGAPVNIGTVKDSVVQLASGDTLPARLQGAKPFTPAAGDQSMYADDGRGWAPRAGFSWSLRRNGGTVVRGSYGIFYDRPYDNLWQNLRSNGVVVPGFQLGNAVVKYSDPPASVLAPLVSYRFGTYSRTFPGVTLYQPEMKNGYAQSWFAGIRHRAPGRVEVELNVLGSLGRRLVTTDILNRDFTLPPEQRTPVNATGRLTTALPDVSYRANQGASNYSAFTALVRRQAGRSAFQATYTWSHSIDNQSEALAGDFFNLSYTRAFSGAGPGGISAFSQQYNSRADRANSDFDQRQNLVFSAWYDLPGKARGWSLAVIGALRSGFPYTVYGGFALAQPLLNWRADVTGPVRADSGAGAPRGARQLLNPAAFRQASSGLQGNTGRNAFRGPGQGSVDASLGRTFAFRRLGEAGRATLRADAFNVLNHANLGNPVAVVGAAGFGAAYFGRTGFDSGFPALTPFRESARQVQILLRLEF